MNCAKLKSLPVIILIMLFVASCGGGGNNIAGIGGTGITTSGTITGFGSIFVNGVEYDLASAGIIVDGTPASDTDLTIGMVVKVEGTVSSDGVTGTARSVSYNTELQGPISSAIAVDADNISKTFSVLGRTIVVNVNTTSFEDFSFSAIAANDAVEVSGYLDQNGILQATRIKKQSSSEVKFSGVVSNYNNVNQFEIINGSETITVIFTGNYVISNGDVVRIRGAIAPMHPSITVNASEIETKENIFTPDEDNASLEGIITDFIDSSNFRVNGQVVDASSASVEPSTLNLGNGLRVEVEGAVINGTLLATSIEGRGGNLKIFTTVSQFNTPSNGMVLMEFPNLQSLPIHIDLTTSMKDDDQELKPFRGSDINPGDYLEISAYLSDTNSVIATSIERRKLHEYEVQILRGPLTAIDTGMNTVEIQGIQFTYDLSSTDFEDKDDEINGVTNINEFLTTTLQSGDIVQIKDNVPSLGAPDGIIEELDLKN